MGYALHAVIAEAELWRGTSRDVAAARLAPLGQGLSLMPMTDELFDAVTDGSSAGPLGFWRLPGSFDRLLADWSAAGPVAYVEAEYVVVLARYTATNKATGKRIDVRVAHHFVVRGGLIVRFEQFVDTAKVREAMTDDA
jgi:ketosteroid isomerase-like protein